MTGPEIDADKRPDDAQTSLRRELLLTGGASFGARALTAVFSLVSLPLLVHSLGSVNFATYTVILSIPSMAAFVESGLGSGVRSAVASKYATAGAEQVRSTIGGSMTLVARASAMLGLLSLLCAALVPWSSLLGIDRADESTLRWSAAVVIVIYCTSLPLSVAARALEASGRTHAVALAAVVPSFTLLATALILRELDSSSLFLFTFTGAAATATGALVLYFYLARVLNGAVLPVRPALGLGREIWETTWPMLVVAIALSVSYATDPVVIGSRVGLDAVGQYAVGLKLSQVVTLTVYATSPALWSFYVKARQTQSSRRRGLTLRLVLAYAGIAAVAAVPFAILGPWLSSLWTGDEIVPPRALFVAFAVWAIILAAQLPLAMRMNHPRGLRFQACTTALMALVNLPLSIVLATTLGVSGPVWSSALCLLIFHALPLAAKQARQSRSGEEAPE